MTDVRRAVASEDGTYWKGTQGNFLADENVLEMSPILIPLWFHSYLYLPNTSQCLLLVCAFYSSQERKHRNAKSR